MTAADLLEGSLFYLSEFGPYLLIFFAIAFAHKIIDLIIYAIGASKKYWG